MAVYCVIYAVERNYSVEIFDSVIETKTYAIREFTITDKNVK